MSIRNEQCNKVCRIIDDVLANRPTERDSLIVAVQKAFKALEGNSSESPNGWIPCTPETMPEEYSEVLCCDAYGEQIIGMPYVDDDSNTGYSAESEAMYMVDCIAWQPLPEPYQPKEK